MKRYSIKVGNQWVSSPTNSLTDKPQFRAVFTTRAEAFAVAKFHHGVVMVEPAHFTMVPKERAE